MTEMPSALEVFDLRIGLEGTTAAGHQVRGAKKWFGVVFLPT